ncbi:MAG: SDR family oxidoreductase [Acidobacteriota bacterium]
MKTVLITGCSSGFGRLTAETFHRNGWNVIATMRSPERETELTRLKGVFVARLDVTDLESIRTTVREGVERFGTIDVLVNNAGYGGHSLFEQASDEVVRAMYETNVFGVMNVSREVLPILRAQGEGCIVNVTSMAGLMGAPLISIYASTKHAVQGLTESMAFEYGPLGVTVKSVLPGSYQTTGFTANTDDRIDGGGDGLASYAQELRSHLDAVAEQMAMQSGRASDPQEVADAIYSCATSDSPVHNPVGADAEMLVTMMRGATRQSFLDQLGAIVLPSDLSD